MSEPWWTDLSTALACGRGRSRPTYSVEVRRVLPGLEVLEERIALDAASAGINGINAIGLTTPGGTALTGAGVLIGQVEPGRPAMSGLDAPATLNRDVTPAGVFLNDGPAVAGKNLNDHAEEVAGVMIANGATDKGVAPGASLYSSAADGELDTALAFQHISDGAKRPHIMSFSGGESLPAGASLDGSSLLTQFVDWSATTRDVLYAIAGNEGKGGLPIPTDEYNGLTVASTTKDAAGVFTQLSDFNNTEEDAAGPRTSVDLVAPGEDINVPKLGGGYELKSGTSLAAPQVAGAAALLQQYAKDRIAANAPGFNVNGERSMRHEVMKAVLMNSADKLKDAGDGLLLGMDKTIYKKDGTTWLQSAARDDMWNLRGDLLPLDLEMGTGQLDVNRAVKQFAPGEQGVNLTEPPIGWNLEYISADTAGGIQKYAFANKLKGDSYVSLTMA